VHSLHGARTIGAVRVSVAIPSPLLRFALEADDRPMARGWCWTSEGFGSDDRDEAEQQRVTSRVNLASRHRHGAATYRASTASTSRAVMGSAPRHTLVCEQRRRRLRRHYPDALASRNYQDHCRREVVCP
jgi:hypothetical protein